MSNDICHTLTVTGPNSEAVIAALSTEFADMVTVQGHETCPLCGATKQWGRIESHGARLVLREMFCDVCGFTDLGEEKERDGKTFWVETTEYPISPEDGGIRRPVPSSDWSKARIANTLAGNGLQKPAERKSTVD